MTKGILGRKLGMTQVFDDKGRVVPVTVVEAGPCTVVQKKTVDSDGYSAIQVGFGDIQERKVTKPRQGHFARGKVKPARWLRELRLDDVTAYEVGQQLGAGLFAPGERVDVTGISRGKGFAGGIRRHGFKRGPMAHGSKYHRGPGSLQSRDASRVFKGRKLPGHLGAVRRTALNLSVVAVDTDKNLILIRGAVPGVHGGLVTIRDSVKA
ncbi:MAG: 50S ribosomal protein L3 [Bacillota bacterium]